MRMKFLRATEDTTVVLVYPSTLQQYRQAFGIFGASGPDRRGGAVPAGGPRFQRGV